MEADIKQKYIEELHNILENANENEKVPTFINLFTAYAKYCYQNNLPIYDYELYNKSKTLFIIDSKPLESRIDNEKKEEALDRLKNALNNISNGIPDGISVEDANLILSANIQNTRISLANSDMVEEDIDFFDKPLTGCCGFSQAVSVYPLLELGLKVTINNASFFPDSFTKHAFATCIIPIKEDNKIYEKQFLIDATYRQFFLAIGCNEGRYYDGNKSNKDNTSPYAGYYVCQTEKGRAFAYELLSKGFIELTEENAKTFGVGFSMETIHLNTPLNIKMRIIKHKGKEYIDAINNKCEELDYSIEELLEYGVNVSLYDYIGDIKKNRNLIQ